MSSRGAFQVSRAVVPQHHGQPSWGGAAEATPEHRAAAWACWTFGR
jgi:hypothetical protein